MCGIIGYTGLREAEPILIQGLRRLEHRSYDSTGLATLTGDRLHLRRLVGRVADLIGLLRERPAPGCLGLGHLRWATHGAVTESNAHPQLSGDGRIAVVHNGVIENYATLRRQLQREGYALHTDTDTEVIAQMIARAFAGDLPAAVRATVSELEGTFGLAVISPQEPEMIVGAAQGSPLVIGLGEEEYFLASDSAALLGLTQRFLPLSERQMCVLTPDDWQLHDLERTPRAEPRNAKSVRVDWEPADMGKNGLDSTTLREVYQQPSALEDVLRGRLALAEATAYFDELHTLFRSVAAAQRFVLTGCGSSYHAALIGELLLEQVARIPVEVEYASELRYRNPPMDRDTVVLAISQSGETADTLAAVQEYKRKGHPTLALCNTPGSSLARTADGVIYLHAGPELGVASTKSFTAELLSLALFSLQVGRLRELSSLAGGRMIEELRAIPSALRRALAEEDAVARVAQRFRDARSFLYLGRHFLYPLALEGALKLKEISYVHAEGCSAAELKHGPLALIDGQTPCVFLLPRGPLFSKVAAVLEEVRHKGGPVLAIVSEADREAVKADEVLTVPDVPDYLQPLVMAVPLQLFAYHMARLRGCDVDQPRHLTKTVTVE
jgi:glucosamine--fructose-6-phosphate aminotransferase (isomerizing)